MLKLFESAIEQSTTVENDPLVSVIIANYNYGRFLAQAIGSVFNQSYRNFELIVVDDGSTDNSREIIALYKDKLIPIFQENQGQGAAFNAGIARSQGEIICFLDSDDFYHQDKLAKVVQAFRDNPQWVQISHGRTSVDAEGEIIGRDPTFFNQGDVRLLLLRQGRYACAVTSGLVYRRSVLNKVLPIPKRPRAGDTYLTATVPFYGEVGYIKQPLMFYRIHGKNMNAATNNFSYLIEQLEDTANCINTTATKFGLSERFNLEIDAEYLSLKALQAGGTSWKEAGRIFWLTWLESIAIGHDLKDTLERFLRRGLSALFPHEAMAYFRLSPRRYLRYKLTGKLPKNFQI